MTFKHKSIDISSDVIRARGIYFSKESIDTLIIELIHNTTTTFVEGDLIEAWRDEGSGDVKKFTGYIRGIEKQPNQVKVVLNCRGKMEKAVRAKPFNKTFLDTDSDAGVLSSIYEDIVDTYTDLTSDVTSSSGFDTISIFPFVEANPFETMEQIRKILNWIHYVDYEDSDNVKLLPPNTTVETTTLQLGASSGTNNIMSLPVWSKTTHNLANQIKINGAQELGRTSEPFNGDGTTTDFTLNYEPDVTTGDTEVTVDGTIQRQGKDGITTDSYDYTVNVANKKIKFESGSIPAGGTAIIVKYVAKQPIPLDIEDPASITTHGEFSVAHPYYDSESSTVDDVFVKGKQLLNLTKTPRRATTLKLDIDIYTARLGQKYQVNDYVNSEYGEFFVEKLVWYYPHTGDEINVVNQILDSSGILNSVNTRIKRIEEEFMKNQSKIISSIKVNADISLRSWFVQTLDDNKFESFADGVSIGDDNIIVGTERDFSDGDYDGTETSGGKLTLS